MSQKRQDPCVRIQPVWTSKEKNKCTGENSSLKLLFIFLLNKREGVQIKKNSTDIGSFSKRDAVYLNLKKNGLWKIFAYSQKQQVRKFENETVGKGKP